MPSASEIVLEQLLQVEGGQRAADEEVEERDHRDAIPISGYSRPAPLCSLSGSFMAPSQPRRRSRRRGRSRAAAAARRRRGRRRGRTRSGPSRSAAPPGRRPRAAPRAPSPIAGRSDRRGGLEVVDEQVGVVERARRRRRPRGAAARERLELLGGRGRGRAGRPRRRPRRCEARRLGQQDDRVRAGLGQRLDPLAGPADQRREGRAARGRRRRARRRSPRGRRPRPRRAAAPPPRRRCRRRARRRPGSACSISIRSGGRSQPRSRSAASARAARFSPSTPGQTTSSRVGLGDLDHVGERQRLEQRAELVQPVAARAGRGRGRG